MRMTYQTLGGVTIVVIEHPAEPLPPPDLASVPVWSKNSRGVAVISK
jgi:hypothetical protein